MKVSIIGPGKVGMVLAYTLMMKGVAREIVLIGSDRAKAEGEAMDLMHAQAFLQVPVTVYGPGNSTDTAGSAVVAVCASVPSPEGMTDRNAIAEGNTALLRSILPTVAKAAPGTLVGDRDQSGGCHDLAGLGVDGVSAGPCHGKRHPGGFHPLPRTPFPPDPDSS